MAGIEVNPRKLRQLAAAVADYCDTQEQQMHAANGNVKSGIAEGWQGSDAREFLVKWETSNGGDSTAQKFRSSLLDVRKKLISSAEIYEDAQIDICNRASQLPR